LIKNETYFLESIPILYVCPHPLTPSPVLGEGFRARAAKLGCTLFPITFISSIFIRIDLTMAEKLKDRFFCS
jgi:hypothetical protein